MKFNSFNFQQSFQSVISRGAFGSVVRVFLAVLAVMFIASCSSSSKDPIPLPPVSTGITASPSTLSFGVVPLNTTKKISVTVANTSSVQVTGLNIGALSGEFSMITTCGVTLDAGASCAADVTLAPLTEGTKSAILVITSTNGGNVDVPITGSAEPLRTAKIYLSHPSANPSFTFALGNDNKLYAWGDNEYGQLGVNDTDNRTVPTAVKVPEGVTFQEIYSGNYHVIAKGSNGKFYAWGNNNEGQLGVGDTANKSIPTEVRMPQNVTSFDEVYVLNSHTIAKGSDGKHYAWGSNKNGRLGIGNYENKHEPTLLAYPNGMDKFTDIYAHLMYTVAKGIDGKIYVWGYNGYSQLGTGADGDKNAPTKIDYPNGVETYTTVVTGNKHVGAIGDNNKLYMWGSNSFGQLGVDDIEVRNAPTAIVMPAGVTFTSISLGNEHTNAIGDNGKLYGWGRNDFGQLGIGNNDNQKIPTESSSDTRRYSSVYSNSSHNLAKDVDGKLYAWGKNNFGQLGVSDTEHKNAPTAVVMPAGVTLFTDFYYGKDFTFAKGDNGKYYGWGLNDAGQLGLNDTTNRVVPTELTFTQNPQ